ncbi:Sec-independent protein translocase protein TatA [compost metagenome]
MGIFDWKHWLVILLVVVLLFGTKRLKSLGPDLGEAIKGFRRAMNPAEGGLSAETRGVPCAELHGPQAIDAQPRSSMARDSRAE